MVIRMAENNNVYYISAPRLLNVRTKNREELKTYAVFWAIWMIFQIVGAPLIILLISLSGIYLLIYIIGIGIMSVIVSILFTHQIIIHIALKTIDQILIPRDFNIDRETD